MSQTSKKKVTVYMPAGDHERFKKACKESNTTMANKFLHMAIKFNKQKESK